MFEILTKRQLTTSLVLNNWAQNACQYTYGMILQQKTRQRHLMHFELVDRYLCVLGSLIDTRRHHPRKARPQTHASNYQQNMLMQYTENVRDAKFENFQLKIFDISLNVSLNIGCGHTLI